MFVFVTLYFVKSHRHCKGHMVTCSAFSGGGRPQGPLNMKE